MTNNLMKLFQLIFLFSPLMVQPLLGDELFGDGVPYVPGNYELIYITFDAAVAQDVYAADLDGDGDMDVLSASYSDDKIAWYENDGDVYYYDGGGDNLPEKIIITTEAYGARSVYASDLDGDGDMDVLSASLDDDKIAWYENDGNGNFMTHVITTNADGATSVHASDLDGDGDMDVLSASYYDDKIAWYENDGDGNFMTHVITTDAVNATFVYAADLDGDGDMDVLSASYSDDKIAWYENDGNGNFTTHVITMDADGAYSVYASDLDGDGDMDVLSASRVDDKIAWHENDGSGNFITHIITTDADGAISVHASDLDGDGDMDVLSASYYDDKIAWYENDGDGNFMIHIIVATIYEPRSVYAADIDGDGDQDVLFASQSSNMISGRINLCIPDCNGTCFGEANIDDCGDCVGGATGMGYNISCTGCMEIFASTYDPGNIFSDPDQCQYTEHIITTNTDGTISVYAADVDGDGDMDLLSASYADDTIAWYENDGSESFTVHVITTDADGAYSVYAVDVDGDGDMDVLSASEYDDKISWYENDGSESFTEHVITTSANGAVSVYAVDVDGDGDMDVLSSSLYDDTIAWYENDGSESFTEHVITTSANGARVVYAADVDGDGDMDLLSASEYDDKISWYENDGSESFTEHVITTSANGAVSVYAVDVDGDGDMDVLSASYNDDKIAWYENDGSESFTEHIITTSADAAYSVYAADVDGDGDMDVLSASNWDDTIAWYENDGSESFTEHEITTSANGARVVYAADVDGDGDLDILSAIFFDDKIVWYENNVSCPAGYFDCNGECGGEDMASCLDCNDTMYGYALLDDCGVCVGGTTGIEYNISCTGCMDPISISYDSGNIISDPEQCEYAENVITTSADAAFSVYAADVDGDGDMDVLSASNGDDKIAWYENDGESNFTEHVITTQADKARSVYAVDVDGDGDMDVLSASEDDDKIAWYENDGSESFTEHVITTDANGAFSVYAVDVDGDGDMDVLSASAYDDTIAWYENDGSGSFTTHIITTSADKTYSVYATDVDGDGDMDVLSASADDDKIAWYENDGNGSFITHVITTNADRARSVYAADVDSDGDMDVLSTSANDNKTAWYENDGSQNFTEHVITTSADNPYSVHAADVDGDGDIDVLSASQGDHKVLWYENDGSESFTEHEIIAEVVQPVSVYVADIDGDGDMDVLSASRGDFKIAWYENDVSCPAGYFDCTGVCGGENESEFCQDCYGVTDGIALIDECGECIGGTTGFYYNESCGDCAGVAYGDNLLDDCSTCDNDPANDCVQDCNLEWGGSATYDSCTVCSGGTSGHVADSDIDECGNCFGSCTEIGETICTDDNDALTPLNCSEMIEGFGCDYNYGGTPLYEICPLSCDACPSFIECTENENDIIAADCAGDCAGEAFYDSCGSCSGGTSGHNADSAQDECGNCFGTCIDVDGFIVCSENENNIASGDDCGVCSGGDSEHVANSDMDDCGECFGSNYTETCYCSDEENCDDYDEELCTRMDCNGQCYGSYIVDGCGNCTVPSESDCVLGCTDIAATNYWGILSCLENFIDEDGDCLFDEGESGEWIEGCVAATQDDGSCVYPEGEIFVATDTYPGATNCGPGTYEMPLVSIQEAIDRSERLDTIHSVNIFPYTYQENLTISSDVILKNYYEPNGWLEEFGMQFFEVTLIIPADDNLPVIKIIGDADNRPAPTLSGFTITQGQADYGAGLYIENADPTLSWLGVLRNRAHFDGGGIYLKNANASLEHVLIAENVSGFENAGYYGGGIYIEGSDDVNLDHVTIASNFSSQSGSAIYFSNGSFPKITNSLIWGNNTDYQDISIYEILSDSPVNLGIIIENTILEDFNPNMSYFDNVDPANFYVGLIIDASSCLDASPFLLPRDPEEIAGDDEGIEPGNYHLAFYDEEDVCDNPWIDSGSNWQYLGAYEFSHIDGCMDPDACNYNMAATQDDGSCYYEGEECQVNTWYVDINNTVEGDGTSPESAFLSINSALEVADDGDLILVEPGFDGLAYQENIVVHGAVKIQSTEYADLFPDDIDQLQHLAIIDGSRNGSVVRFMPSENNRVTAELKGFTIRNGSGTPGDSSPDLFDNKLYGGGIYIQDNLPSIQYNNFINNGDGAGAAACWEGGAVFILITPDSDQSSTELRIRYNDFTDNYASFGKIISSRGFDGHIDMTWGYYDVFHQTSRDNGHVSSYWCFSDGASFDYRYSGGRYDAIYNPGSVTIDNTLADCEEEPCTNGDNYTFSGIEKTISRLYADEENPVVIDVVSVNDARYPIQMADYISLDGGSGNRDEVIIDIADRGTGFWIENTQGSNIHNLTIKDGNGDRTGGAIYVKNADIEIDSVSFLSNQSTDGGALKIVRDDYRSDDTVRINNSFFDSNGSTGNAGGAISNIRGNLQINNSIIEKSYVFSDGSNSDSKGGAIYSYGGNLNINNTDFIADPTLETFPGSQLTSYGGAIFIEQDLEGSARGRERGVDHNVINTNTTNSSADFGGAYYFQESTIAVGLNIYGTSADKGAAIYIGENASEGSDYEVKIINCTLVNNTVTDENGGGAIWIDEATGEGVSIINTIIWDNYDICTPPDVCTSLNGIGFNESDVMYLKLIHSSIQDDPASYPGNVLINDNMDPAILATNQFNVDPTLDYDNLYALLEGSPCINAGTADLDLDGVDDIIESFADWEVENYEIFHGIPDMGYVEFECPVDHPELDACGNCYEDTGSDGYTSDSSECGDDDDLLGDINGDGTLNILDVVTIVNLVMSGGYDVVADMNADGFLNILDVVSLINQILTNNGGLTRGKTATEAAVKYGNGMISYESDGVIAGVQLFVSGDFEITDNFLPVGWDMGIGESTIILYSQDGSHLEDSRLFSYEGDLQIESSIFADWYGSSISVNEVLLPRDYSLDNAYPNPFNPVTNIGFAIPEDGYVTISVYDLQGRLIRELVDGNKTAGYYKLSWNATNQSSGIYFVRMQAGTYVSDQKIMLVK